MSKKQTAGTVRTTISIPTGLKRRMDAMPVAVNWSAVACEAFQLKLAELRTTKEKDAMEAVVARLQSESKSPRYQLGFGEGHSWARTQATISEFECLENIRINMTFEYGWRQFFSKPACTSENIAKAIAGPEWPDFWLRAVEAKNRNRVDREFLHGFLEGALTVWDAVKDRV